MNRPLLVVRNVLVSPEGGFLLGLRHDTLLWEFPGGKVDEETVERAGRREQREETGMELRGPSVLVGYADCRHIKHPERRSVELFLLWKEWDGIPTKVEGVHLSLRWFWPEDAPPLHHLMQGTRKFFEEGMWESTRPA